MSETTKSKLETDKQKIIDKIIAKEELLAIFYVWCS